MKKKVVGVIKIQSKSDKSKKLIYKNLTNAYIAYWYASIKQLTISVPCVNILITAVFRQACSAGLEFDPIAVAQSGTWTIRARPLKLERLVHA